MKLDKRLQKEIITLSLETPDPPRAERNLFRFFEKKTNVDAFSYYLSDIAMLFSVSQFLANFSISRSEELLTALKEIKQPVTRELFQKRVESELLNENGLDVNDLMKKIRLFKKRYLLRITLRDIRGETDVLSSMDELTFLAEAIISKVLQWSLKIIDSKFGDPSNNSLGLIGLGKLGGEELNYSSDVDLIAVYENEKGQTSGVLSPTGVRMNRISNHEFYCKVIELMNKILSNHTDDGIAYRVDLRLRPQGQRGDLAMSLTAYQAYYEAWGRVWERMMLIRARPVAGDLNLCQAFLETIRPFVWRKTYDYSEIEEIRSLKKKIDSIFSRDDIKRGYGGIREAEFFVQTFQLIYGSEYRALRTHRFFNAIQALRWMKIIPEEELTTLWENYLYLRRLEHYLQIKDDLRTHTLPSSEVELKSLGRKMGSSFPSEKDFLSDLRLRRMQIKSMYNSLLGSTDDIYAEALTLLEGNLSEEELKGYLSFRRVKRPEKGIYYISRISEYMRLFKAQKERSLLRKIIPELLERVLSSESPDRALAGIDGFINTLGLKGAYITAFIEQRGLLEGIIKIFSLSSLLTPIFLSNSQYLDILIEEWTIRKTLKLMEEELNRNTRRGPDFLINLNDYKKAEEVRLGIFFLMQIINTHNLLRYLSHLADLTLRFTLNNMCQDQPFTVIGLGKLGGRELTFGSDLDIIFLSEIPEGAKIGEKMVKTLTTYTDRGVLYNVDVRLRPDGSRGAIVKNIEGYKNYYLKNAHPWELQALLRSRPVAGDEKMGVVFMQMGREVITQRGREVKYGDIIAMREKIKKELSNEAEGIDIKLGPGGIEEIEFFVQWLQLQNGWRFPEIIVQNTVSAIHRLGKSGIIKQMERDTLAFAYRYYRKLETFLRLNEVHIISKTSEITTLAAIFMGHKTEGEFLENLHLLREDVLRVVKERE